MISKSTALTAITRMAPIMDMSELSNIITTKTNVTPSHSRPTTPKVSGRKRLPPKITVHFSQIESEKGKEKENKLINKIELLGAKETEKKHKTLKLERGPPDLNIRNMRLKYSEDVEVKVHGKIERRLTDYGLPNIEELVAKKIEYYGSIDKLKSRIKEEIYKEYSSFATKIDLDTLADQSSEYNVIPQSILSQVKDFQRYYGKNTTLLPFIGQSKSLVGNVLDQGLRALHFNLGPGTLVHAIMDTNKEHSKSVYSVEEDWWNEESKKIDNVLNSHDLHTEPKQ